VTVPAMLPSAEATTPAPATDIDLGAESIWPTRSLSPSPRRSRAGARLATGLLPTALAGLDLHQRDSIERFHVLITFRLCQAFVARCTGIQSL